MRTVAVFLVALTATFIAVPLYSFSPAIYGCPSVSLDDLKFVKDYVVSWWHKIFRTHVCRQLGPAENATANQEEARRYSLPTVQVKGEPKNVYELLNTLKNNKTLYSGQLLAYLRQNNMPNKSVQVDLHVVPENVYVTIVWNKQTLEVYDGWTGDRNCQVYITVTATSQLIMNLYVNRENVETLKTLILNAEENGEIAYTINRVNPTIAEYVLILQAVSTVTSIVGWSLLIHEKMRKHL